MYFFFLLSDLFFSSSEFINIKKKKKKVFFVVSYLRVVGFDGRVLTQLRVGVFIVDVVTDANELLTPISACD